MPWVFLYQEFSSALVHIRAAERNFQLIVDLASDINTHILLERGKKTPDTYRQSFVESAVVLSIKDTTARKLALSAGLRNILVHEYDFEEDYEQFYRSVKELLPAYREYMQVVHHYLFRNAP